MEELGLEAIISIALTVFSIIVTFISYYFYVRGKLHKAAAGAITNAEQEDKTGEEKLELAVEQVYSLIPISLKPFIHKKSVRKIVQAAFDKIEDYAQKQVEKAKKKDVSGGSDSKEQNEQNAESAEISQSDEITDSGGQAESPPDNDSGTSNTYAQALNKLISSNISDEEIATTSDDQSATQVNMSRACSTNNNSFSRRNIMENNIINNVNNNKVNDEPVTCYEEVGARTEYSKKFNNPKTGLHTTVLFSSPVHYNNGTEMAEIDNDFTDGVNDEGEEVFENRKNKFLVRLAKSTAQNKLVELVEGDCRIAMSPVASIMSKINRFVNSIRRDIQAVCNLRRSPFATAKSKLAEISHGAAKFALKRQEPSDIRFGNAIQNCDLEYLVENNRVKENIIVNAKAEAYEFVFNLNLTKLEARMSGKTIELFIPETNEVKYMIPAPFMYDASGKTSDKVQYSLEGSTGKYTLRVIADDEWINAVDRQFPVIIDPQIMANTTDIITMGEYNNGNIVAATGDKISLGCNYYDGQAHVYELGVAINASSIIKSIGSQTRVLHAILEFTKADGGYQPSTSKGFSVESENKTIDQFTYNGVNNRIEIDITSQIQAAISNQKDIKLRVHRNSTSNESDYIVFMTEKAYVSEYRPRIFIDYVSSRLESKDTAYMKMSAGRAGTGTVNLNTLDVKWEHPDLSVHDGSLELPISHIYNSNVVGHTADSIMEGVENKEIETDDFKCGAGFKLNIQQRLITKPVMDSAHLMGSENKVYIDGQGNHHDFVEKYYFKDPTYGFPHYVDRAECVMKPTGELTYNDNGTEREVIYEVSNELGMQLESFSRYVDYMTSNKEYVSKYYYVFNGKRYYVERKGDVIYIPTFYYTVDNAEWYVTPDEVKEINGEYYYSAENIKLTKIITQQRVVDNTIKIKKTVKGKLLRQTNYFDLELYEERKYCDNTIITAFDFICTDDIKNLNNQIKNLVEYQQDISEQIAYCTGKISEYQIQYSNQLEAQNIQDKISDLQNKSFAYSVKQQNELYDLQKKQLELQFLAQQSSNKAYFSEQEIGTINEYYDKQEYNRVGENEKTLREQFNDWAIAFIKKLLGIESKFNVSDELGVSVEFSSGDIKYDNGFLTGESTKKLNRYQNAVNNLMLINQAKTLVKSQRDTFNQGLLLYYNDCYNKLSQEENIRTREVAIQELEDSIIEYRKKMEDADLQINALALQRDILIEEQKKRPTDFIMTANKTILGFDYYGKLVVVCDMYENQIYIVYDGDNNIKSLKDKDGKELLLATYENGTIKSMSDDNGRICQYEYENGLLKKVVYPDGEASEFDYGTDGRLTQAKGIVGESVNITYGESALNIFEKTDTARIDKNGITTCNERTINSYAITRTSDYTTVVTTKDGKTHYVFDRMGRPVTVYTKSGDNERSASYEYNGLNKAFSCSELMSENNLIVNPDFSTDMTNWAQSVGDNAVVTDVDSRRALQISGYEDCYIKQTVNITDEIRKKLPKNGVMVLSAWAKAQSMSVRHNKRITAYGKDLFTEYEETAANVTDKLRNNRRFGLKAVVEYTDSTLNETSECTYDFYNNDWQLAALPIKIKDVSKVTSITVYFDYSYNYGAAYVTDFKLCKCGDFTERTYDDDRNVKSVYDGTTLTEYEYVEKFPIKAIMTVDGKKYENIMRYNVNGALLYSRDYLGNCVENTYNDKGILIQTAKYNENDSTSKYVEEYKYDDKGNLLAELDPRGEVNGEVLKTDFEYSRGLTIAEKYSGDRKAVFSYDYDSDAKTGMSGDNDGEANGTIYKYTKDYLTTVSHNDIDVDYAYDGRGRILETDIAGSSIVVNTYFDGVTAADTDSVTSMYADGTMIRTTADNENRKKIVEDVTSGLPVELLSYEYDGKSDRQKKMVDGVANVTYEYDYTDGVLTKTSYTQHGVNVVLEDKYNSDELLEKSEITIDGVKEQYVYTYDDMPEHNLTDITLLNGVKQSLGRDALGRMHAISQTVNGKVITDENRYYLKYGDRTTNLISSVRFGINGNLDEHTQYKYDKAGNISEVYENGILSARYTYDKLDRLIREDNKVLDKTVVMTYDIGGNILSKTEYGFTLGNVTEKAPITINIYSYKATGWRDQMTSFNGEKCEYDVMGRPTTYRGKTLAWSKYGTLSNYNGNTYTYDANGIRLSKTVNGIMTKFYISGNKILRSVDNVYDIWYNYGVNGIQGMTLKNSIETIKYVFRKNAQGDVTHIFKLNIDGSLTLAAKYTYDAWGNCAVMEVDGSGIGVKNPIRYRGYYFDVETGLYYLKSRYFDPETGRFISADDTSYIETNILNGLNLYAYCHCNPINFIDSNGNSPFAIVQSIFSFADEIFNTLSKSFFAMSNKVLSRLSSMSMYVLDSMGGASFNNLYLGLMNISSESSRLGGILKTLGRGAKILGRVMIVVDIGFTIYNNFTNPDLSIGRKISDTVVDIGYTGLSIGASTLMGTLLGSAFPGVGNIIGACLGFIIGVGMEIATWFGDWYQNFKEDVYNFFTVTIPNAWDKFVDGWNWFWSFDWL